MKAETPPKEPRVVFTYKCIRSAKEQAAEKTKTPLANVMENVITALANGKQVTIAGKKVT